MPERISAHHRNLFCGKKTTRTITTKPLWTSIISIKFSERFHPVRPALTEQSCQRGETTINNGSFPHSYFSISVWYILIPLPTASAFSVLSSFLFASIKLVSHTRQLQVIPLLPHCYPSLQNLLYKSNAYTKGINKIHQLLWSSFHLCWPFWLRSMLNILIKSFFNNWTYNPKRKPVLVLFAKNRVLRSIFLVVLMGSCRVKFDYKILLAKFFSLWFHTVVLFKKKL